MPLLVHYVQGVDEKKADLNSLRMDLIFQNWQNIFFFIFRGEYSLLGFNFFLHTDDRASPRVIKFSSGIKKHVFDVFQ